MSKNTQFYKITGKTDAWTAQRDELFNGKTEVDLYRGLTLQEAQKTLLDMYNEYFEDSRPFAVNWGLAVSYSQRSTESALSREDGTRQFECDGRTFNIQTDEI